MNSARQDSVSEAEIQNLLGAWVLVRSKVWNASYGVITANAPPGWETVSRAVSTSLRANGGSGFRSTGRGREHGAARARAGNGDAAACRALGTGQAPICRCRGGGSAPDSRSAVPAALAEQGAQATADEARALAGEPVPPERVPGDPAAPGGSRRMDNTTRSAAPPAEGAPKSFEQEGVHPERRAEDRPFSRKDPSRNAAPATAGNVRGKPGK